MAIHVHYRSEGEPTLYDREFVRDRELGLWLITILADPTVSAITLDRRHDGWDATLTIESRQP